MKKKTILLFNYNNDIEKNIKTHVIKIKNNNGNDIFIALPDGIKSGEKSKYLIINNLIYSLRRLQEIDNGKNTCNYIFL
jgi:hypothetical protein